MQNRKRYTALIAAVIVLLMLVIEPIAADAAVLKYGSRGEAVRTVQSKLKRWGYYSGSVDGIFGSGTKSAVMYFQRTNGLTVDGMVGPQTSKALGLSSDGSVAVSGSSSGSSGSGDLYLLARLVYGEARGESYKGQVAVAAVVLNRV